MLRYCSPHCSKLPLARPAPAASSRNNLFSSEACPPVTWICSKVDKWTSDRSNYSQTHTHRRRRGRCCRRTLAAAGFHPPKGHRRQQHQRQHLRIRHGLRRLLGVHRRAALQRPGPGHAVGRGAWRAAGGLRLAVAGARPDDDGGRAVQCARGEPHVAAGAACPRRRADPARAAGPPRRASGAPGGLRLRARIAAGHPDAARGGGAREGAGDPEAARADRHPRRGRARDGQAGAQDEDGVSPGHDRHHTGRGQAAHRTAAAYHRAGERAAVPGDDPLRQLQQEGGGAPGRGAGRAVARHARL